jgi:hypothetical protein
MIHVQVHNPKNDDNWGQDVLDEFEIEAMSEKGLMVNILDDDTWQEDYPRRPLGIRFYYLGYCMDILNSPDGYRMARFFHLCKQ